LAHRLSVSVIAVRSRANHGAENSVSASGKKKRVEHQKEANKRHGLHDEMLRHYFCRMPEDRLHAEFVTS